jgi:hypothetical protein
LWTRPQSLKLYFLSGNRSTFQFYYHQAGLARPSGIAVSSAAAAASHLSQSYRRERTQIWTFGFLDFILSEKHLEFKRTI